MTELYDHQKKLLKHCPDKYGIFWGCGLGKTRMALELIKRHNPKNALIICPKSLAEQWREQCDHTVIHKELFKKKASDLERYDCLVIDELHFFEGMQGFKKKSQMLKALLCYIKRHNPRYIYGLTGTPYMSTPWNIYAAAEILGRKWDYKLFKETFFNDVNMGMRWPIPVVKRGIEPLIATITQRIGDVVKMEDCFDVPEQIYQTEYFELTRDQESAINALQDTNQLARWTKVHQINGGTLKGNGYEPTRIFRSEKLSRLLELIAEHPLIAVVCRYNAEMDTIYKAITDKYPGKFVRRINGSVDANERHHIVCDMQKQADGVILLNSACSEGYELPNIPLMIFYSLDFSYKNYQQMTGRILRANYLKKNVYKHFVIKGSIDEDVYKSIKKKEDFKIAIYEINKISKNSA